MFAGFFHDVFRMLRWVLWAWWNLMINWLKNITDHIVWCTIKGSRLSIELETDYLPLPSNTWQRFPGSEFTLVDKDNGRIFPRFFNAWQIFPLFFNTWQRFPCLVRVQRGCHGYRGCFAPSTWKCLWMSLLTSLFNASSRSEWPHCKNSCWSKTKLLRWPWLRSSNRLCAIDLITPVVSNQNNWTLSVASAGHKHASSWLSCLLVWDTIFWTITWRYTMRNNTPTMWDKQNDWTTMRWYGCHKYMTIIRWHYDCHTCTY